MANSTTKILNDAYDDLHSEASEAAEDAQSSIRNVARELPYVLLGAARVNAQRTRRAFRTLFEFPGNAVDRLRSAPDELRETFWDRAEAGRDLVGRVEDRKDVREARKRGKAARSAVKGAATATRKAAGAAARAASEAVDAVDGNDTRPYDERTVEELYELAAERDIEGRSQMNKAELVKALRSNR